MAHPSLAELSQKLESENSKDRMLALAQLRDVAPLEAMPLIKKVLDDEVLQIRSMAVFALGIKQTEESYPLLIRLLETDGDYGIRADAAGALGYLQDERALKPLLRAFYEDTSWLVRFSAAVSLGNLGRPEAKDALVQALGSGEAILEQAAIAALGEIGAVDTVDRLVEFVSSDNWLVRQRLAEALGALPCEKSLAAVKFLTKDDHPQVQEAAQFSLQKLEA
ncbi:HEAT-like repeat protein [[Synechococcus] sp. NIES-970]|nr:HEAT-like repeat protein [[Synechococcus] sp. NIES-970]